MNHSRLWLGCLLLLHCRSSDDDLARARRSWVPPPSEPVTAVRMNEPQALAPPAQDAGVDVATATAVADVRFPADWCSRLDGLPAAIRIANAHNLAVSMNCLTDGLTSQLTDEQYDEWRTYLQDYTFLMAGCVPDYDPPEGGISVFGPANTAFVGAARAQLSPTEARLLTDAYVRAFGAELMLSAEESGALTAYLVLLATAESDGAATGSLSTCAPDAGL